MICVYPEREKSHFNSRSTPVFITAWWNMISSLLSELIFGHIICFAWCTALDTFSCYGSILWLYALLIGSQKCMGSWIFPKLCVYSQAKHCIKTLRLQPYPTYLEASHTAFKGTYFWGDNFFEARRTTLLWVPWLWLNFRFFLQKKK